MGTTTTNYGFYKPADAETGYATDFATGMDNADTAIKAALDLKAPLASPVLTGATQVGTLELGHATDTTISRTGAGAIAVEGVAVTLSTDLETRLGGAGAPDATEIGYVNGVTSAIQTQLNAKAEDNLDTALADGEYTGVTRTLVAFNDIDIGELVMYKLDTTLKFQLADVSEDIAAVGISTQTVVANGTNTVKVLLYGRLRTTGLPTLTIGAPVYRHISTDGLVQVEVPAATGNKLQMIGFGDVDGDTIYFDPSKDVGTVA